MLCRYMFSHLQSKLDFGRSQIKKKMERESDHVPEILVTYTIAVVYVLSGVTQPLIMALAKQAGLADSGCQLYMLFYYLGPSCLIFYLLRKDTAWPSRSTLSRGVFIACFDLGAQALNYTGSTLAGPTFFAVIYSSVTVWTAIFSRFLLSRQMTPLQWFGVCTVFGGLAITAFDSVSLGPDVFHGSMLVFLGSIMHALTYVMNEAVMTVGDERIPVSVNCTVQGIVAMTAMLLWQIVYTYPRFEERIERPMEKAGTTILYALGIMIAFAMANFLHSISFFHTLRHFAGGATSAGVMKCLQAVLVFVFTSLAYCGRLGGNEMCFTHTKLLSLLIVVGGVIVFGSATEQARKKAGYERIQSADIIEAI